MKRQLEVLLAPAELAALREPDLQTTACVVFDVLRATSTAITALANGARAIIPVAEIAEGLALRRQDPAVLLAGEREGLRIRAALTGGIDFDLGNSPHEFTRERVEGRTIVMTTTNGTRALHACAGAAHTLVGALLNVRAVAAWIERLCPAKLLLVCSGTRDQASFEDVLAAGALCEAVWPIYCDDGVADSAHLAHQAYRAHQSDLLGAMAYSCNGQRLLRHPELRDDVAFCLQRDVFDLVAGLEPDGSVRRQSP